MIKTIESAPVDRFLTDSVYSCETSESYANPVKKGKRKKKVYRIPVEAALKLRSHPVSTRKGEKGYDRKRLRQQTDKTIKEETPEEIN
jgi:hypothetical protein